VDVRRLLLAGLAAGALLAPAVPAHAQTYDYTGDCGFDTISDPSPEQTLGGPDRYTGVAYAYAVATTPAGTPLPFAEVEIACELYVNGVLAEIAVAASGTGAAVGGGTFAFRSGETDWVYMCERVRVEAQEFFRCFDGTPPPWDPLGPVRDVVDILNEAFFEPHVDPALCPILAAQYPGVPGIVDIDWEGDVYVLGAGYWDCPPYGDL
jgi:hypothetical protein